MLSVFLPSIAGCSWITPVLGLAGETDVSPSEIEYRVMEDSM